MQSWTPGSLKADEATRNEANAWLAHFAPLVMHDDGSQTLPEVQAGLAAVKRLRAEGPAIKDRLASLRTPDAPELSTTFTRACDALDGVETELRRKLALLAPGNPEGIVDLESLQSSLDERAARQEIGAPQLGEVPPILEMQTSPGSIPGALGMGIFAFGWLSFTTFHMVFMIGGMMHTVGWGALALLGFYAIFYAAGIGMAVGAYTMAAKTSIVLDGLSLTVRRELFGLRREKKWTLSPRSRAETGPPPATRNTSRDYQSASAVLIADEQGRTVVISTGALKSQLQDTADRINAYLAVHGHP